MEETKLIIQKDTITITKNTKGYNWEYKIVKQDNQTDLDWLSRLDYIEKELKRRYGDKE